MKQYFSISNWKEFQHYKDRNPPWIKLHNQLLDNYEFEQLTDATKGHLLCIWMLASRTNNKLPLDQSWIKRKIGANSPVDLKTLERSGFIELQGVGQSASMALVSEEERRDREEERIHSTPYQEILNLYHEILTNNPKVVIYSDERKKKVKKLYNYHDNHKAIEWWENYFNLINESHFLTGKVEGNGRKPFSADFDWILNINNFVKITEGKYHE